MSKIIISQSLDKNHIYVDDDDADERKISIRFMDKFKEKTKSNLLRIIADWIEKQEEMEQI